MMIIRRSLSTLLLIALTATSMLAQKKNTPSGDPELAKKIARFTPTILTANTARLSAKDKLALKKIIEAAKLLDPLFRDANVFFRSSRRNVRFDPTHREFCHRELRMVHAPVSP